MEGKESCQEEELSHCGGAKALPVSSPLPPHLTHSPDLQGEQPLLLMPTVLLGHPFISTNPFISCPPLHLALGYPPALWGPQRVPPNPACRPKGSLRCWCPGHPPLPLPRAHPRPSLWLR